RALAAAKRDREAIVELEWVLPQLEVKPKDPLSPLPRARLALADALWRRAHEDDRVQARILAKKAREGERDMRASVSSSDPLAAWVSLLTEHVLADIETWLKAHK